MLIVRDIFQCKYGMGGPLVELMKELREMMPTGPKVQIMSDASGQFDTIVAEWTLDDFAHWERFREKEFANKGFGDWFKRMMELVDSGRREFYYVEVEF